MAFDINTAQPVKSNGFNINTAREIGDDGKLPKTENILQRAAKSIRPDDAVLGLTGDVIKEAAFPFTPEGFAQPGMGLVRAGLKLSELPGTIAETTKGFQETSAGLSDKPEGVGFKDLSTFTGGVNPISAGRFIADKTISPRTQFEEGVKGGLSAATIGGAEAIGGRALSGFGSVANKAVSKLKSIPSVFMKARRVPELTRKAQESVRRRAGEVIESKTQKIGSVERQGLIKRQDVSPSEISPELKRAEEVLKGQRIIESDIQAQKLQKDLPKLFKKRGGEFGDKLNKLVGNSKTSVRADEVTPKLARVLERFGVLKRNDVGSLVKARAPQTPAENKIFNAWKNFEKGVSENPDIEVDISDLLKTEKLLKSKVIFGKRRTPDKQFTSEVQESLSSLVEGQIKGLRELRSSFAPFFRTKAQAFKELLPFSGEFETTKASKFLEKIGQSATKGGFRPDEARFVKSLEKELNSKIGGRIGEINEKLAKTGQHIETSENLSKQTATKIKDLILKDVEKEVSILEKDISFIKKTRDARLSEIKKRSARLAEKFTRQKFKIKAGIIIPGTAIGLFILRRFIGNTFNNVFGGGGRDN